MTDNMSTIRIHQVGAVFVPGVASVLAPGGRFVLGDLVVPNDASDVVTMIDGDYDRSSTVSDQLGWLAAAGLRPGLAWTHRDLAVLVGQAPPA